MHRAIRPVSPAVVRRPAQCVCPPYHPPRNGQSLGTAFTDIKMGPGVAYFPAISLSFKESVAFNFGSRPLRYPFWSKYECIANLSYTQIV